MILVGHNSSSNTVGTETPSPQTLDLNQQGKKGSQQINVLCKLQRMMKPEWWWSLARRRTTWIGEAWLAFGTGGLRLATYERPSTDGAKRYSRQTGGAVNAAAAC